MNKTTRVTLDLTPVLFEKLEKLVKATGAATKAEVLRALIRNASLTKENKAS